MIKSLYRMIALVVAVLMTVSLCTAAPVEAKSKEKKEAKLSKNTVEAATWEEFAIRLKSSHEAAYYYCDVEKLNEKTQRYEWLRGEECTYTHDGEGKYMFTFYEGGQFRITVSLVAIEDDKDQIYSDTCIANITNVGPASRKFAMLIGSSRELTVENAEFVSARVKEKRDIQYYDPWTEGPWDYYDYYYEEADTGEAEIDGNRITATAAGRLTLIVSYIPKGGSVTEAEVVIEVTDPQYEPFHEYLIAGNDYELQITGASYYSEVKIEPDNEDICTLYSGYWLYIKDAGTCNIKITVDGREFTDKIEAYAPRLSTQAILLKKKKTEKITVTGLPDGIKPVFKSDNKKVAAVTQDGKVKAKAIGNASITVSCGDLITFRCPVTVSKGGIAFEAAKNARKAIGGKYSQDKRMSDGYYDCSSLAWRSYKEAGEALIGAKSYAPTAADLAKGLEAEGKAIAYEFIPAEELQPGDLIFYSSGSNGRYMNIDHVAVFYSQARYYSEWDGSYYTTGIMVHATSPTVNYEYYDWYIPYCVVMICRPVK